MADAGTRNGRSSLGGREGLEEALEWIGQDEHPLDRGEQDRAEQDRPDGVPGVGMPDQDDGRQEDRRHRGHGLEDVDDEVRERRVGRDGEYASRTRRRSAMARSTKTAAAQNRVRMSGQMWAAGLVDRLGRARRASAQGRGREAARQTGG